MQGRLAHSFCMYEFGGPEVLRDRVMILTSCFRRFVLEIADNSFAPVVDHSFRFDDFRQAHDFLEAGTQVGKIVVESKLFRAKEITCKNVQFPLCLHQSRWARSRCATAS